MAKKTRKVKKEEPIRKKGPKDTQYILDLVHKVKDIDCQESFGILAKILDGYLKHLSTKKFYFIPGYSSDDIYQEGLYALSEKAIPDYREEKGPFVNFAKLCIQRHVITILKSANNNKNKSLGMAMSLDSTASTDGEEGPVPISALIPSDDEPITDAAIRKEAHKKRKRLLISELTDLENLVLALYLQNMSYVEIVKYMNKKKRGSNRVNSRVIDNALCRIRKKAELIQKEQDETEDKFWQEKDKRNADRMFDND
jgi:RNA polymerase sporulation-specific sigma factor